LGKKFATVGRRRLAPPHITLSEKKFYQKFKKTSRTLIEFSSSCDVSRNQSLPKMVLDANKVLMKISLNP
jgi:hypothetical protein